MNQFSVQKSGELVFSEEVRENCRLEALRRYDLLNTGREEAFGRLTGLAADLFGVEVAFVALLDSDRQWLKASVGLERTESTLAASFCTYTVKSEDLLVVEDAPEDERIKGSPGVTEAGLRFYAGVPIRTPEGEAIGTFSIMDSEPQVLSEKQRNRLQDLAEMTSEKLERRRKARERDRVARRFEATFEDPGMLVGVLSPQGMLMEANETALQYVEESREEVVGKPFWETPWWPEAMQEEIRSAARRAASGEYVEYEADLKRPGGEAYSVEGTIRPVAGEKGPEALIVSARDVTERKRYQRGLERYREYTDDILDAVDDIFYILDEEGYLERWNQSLSEVTGYSNEEIASMHGTDFFAGSHVERVGSAIEEVFETGDTVVEAPFRTKDGRSVPHEFVATLVEAPDGSRKLVGIGRDIKGRKRREYSLQDRQEKVEDLYEAANRLLRASSEEEVAELVIDLIRETLGYPGVSVRFVSEGQLVPTLVSPETKEFMPERPPFDIEGDTVVARTYREGNTFRAKDLKEQSLEDPTDYGDVRSAVLVPMGEQGVIGVTDPEPDAIGAFDTHLIEVLGTYASAVLGRIGQEEELRGTKNFYEQVLSQVPIDLAVFSPEAEFEYVNPQSVSDPDRREWLLGHTNEEYFRDRGFDPAVGRRRDQAVREAARKKRPTEIEETLQTEEGPRHYLRVHGPVTGLEGEVTHVAGFGLEITEQKKRRHRLEEYREYTDRLLNASEDLFFVVDGEGRLRRWNEQVASVTGYSEEELGGVEVLEFFPEEEVGRVKGAITEGFETGNLKLETSLLTKSGEKIPYEFTGNRVEHPDGKLRLVGIGRDVTERKRREQALEERRGKMEALYEVTRRLLTAESPEAVSDRIHEVLQEVFDYILNNTAFVRGDVIVPQKTTGDQSLHVPYPEPQPIGGNSVSAQALRSGETVVISDVQALENEVEYGEMQSVAAVPIGERGVIVVCQHEATEFEPFDLRLIEVLASYATLVLNRLEHEDQLVEAKEEAEEARELFETIFNNVPVLIDFFDAEGDLEMVNEHWEEVLGWSEEEIKELSDPTEVLYPDPSERQKSLRFMEENPDEWGDFRFQTKGGEILDTTWTGVELSDGRRIGIGLDITARKERERRLREAKEEAEEASQLKTAVLANMSHEIRTPLTSITGFAELLKENLEGEMGTFADRIYESGKRLMKTLDSVLQLSKLEAGVYEMDREPLSLGPLIQETTEMLRLSAKEKGIDLEADLPEDPIEGEWNEGALNRILENLLENAIKFTPEGGSVEVRAWPEQDHVALAVEDTGVGISEEALPHVFEPFKQESEGLAREYEGTGLGLSIVKRLAEALGGSVQVQSEKGEGTCFTVRFPKRKSEANGDGVLS